MNDPMLPPPMHPAATATVEHGLDAELVLSSFLEDNGAHLAAGVVMRGYRIMWPDVEHDVTERFSDENERRAIVAAVRAWGALDDERCVALVTEVYGMRGVL